MSYASWECPKCGWRKVQSVTCEECGAWAENSASLDVAQECFCGTDLEAGICPNGHDPVATGRLVDEVQHRMDQVVDAAVEWHQAGREGGAWMDKADALSAAIDSLLELREPIPPAGAKKVK